MPKDGFVGRIFPGTNEPYHEDSPEDVLRELRAWSNGKGSWNGINARFASDLTQSWISKDLVERLGSNIKINPTAPKAYGHLGLKTIRFLGEVELQWSEDEYKSNYETCRVISDTVDTASDVYLRFTLLPTTTPPISPVPQQKEMSSSAPDIVQDPPTSLPSLALATVASVGSFDSFETEIDDNSPESISADNWIKLFEKYFEKHIHRPSEQGPKNKRRKMRIKIAVMDSGVDKEHDYIRGALKTGRLTIHDSFVNKDLSNQDNIGHGTHITALLLRIAPEAEIHTFKISDSDKIPEDHRVVEAIVAAIELGVDIISMSFGLDEEDPAIQKAIRSAGGENILMFAAASNQGGNHKVTYPAKKNDVICIYSTNGNGNCPEHNPTPLEYATHHFATLGVAVKSAWPRHLQSPRVADSEDISERRMSGTSVATPIAAGIAACILEFALMNDMHDDDFESLRSREGMHKIFANHLVDRVTRLGYHYIHPWSLFKDDLTEHIIFLMSNTLKN